MKEKERLILIFGGKSTEHEVSQRTARTMRRALLRAGYELALIGITKTGRWLPASQLTDEELLSCDWERRAEELLRAAQASVSLGQEEQRTSSLAPLGFSLRETLEGMAGGPITAAVLACHGTNCEDGRLQGLLELAEIPYTGASLTGSALGMDKVLAKQLVQAGGIPVLPAHTLHRLDFERDAEGVLAEAETVLSYPIFAKPARGGSSVGTVILRDRQSALRELKKAFAYDEKVIAEPFLEKMREIEVAVLGNRDVQTAAPGEILMADSVSYYDYETKYLSATGSSLAIPATLDERTAAAIRRSAAEAYRILQCEGYARVDFFLERESGKFYFNEINTLPGFTEISLFPKAFAFEGVTDAELLRRIVDLARKRFEEERCRTERI